MKNLILVISFLLLFVFFSSCDKKNPTEKENFSIEGTWEGTVTYSESPNDPNVLKLMFNKDGDNITGSLIEYDENVPWTFTILNCIVAGNDISFSIDEKEQVQEETEFWNFVGTINGNNINGTFASVDNESESGTWNVTKK